MSKILKSTLLFFVLVGLFSCKDDETTSIYVVPYAEQEPIDNAAIVEFLTNNYFNEEEFINQVNISDFKFDIKFSEIATVTGYDSNNDGVIDSADVDNTTVFNRTPLINYVGSVINNFTIETKSIVVSDVVHTLYILKVVQGQGGEKPKFCDEALLSYEGMTLDKNIFDNALQPVDLDLSGVVKGFSESVSEFNIADLNLTIDNGDGTFTYKDYGVGAVFMPSGLGYYAGPPSSSISTYAPLIFKLKVYGTTELDHDNDGVPTYVEDLNGNHDLDDDNTDLDTLPNYADSNDDNDPVLTINEIIINTYVIEEGDAIPELLAGEVDINSVTNYSVTPNIITITRRIYKDTDGDGILDYLDSDS